MAETKQRVTFKSLPLTVQANLLECITPTDMDAPRYHALVSEHTPVGLSPKQYDKIFSDVMKEWDRRNRL
jgi:hypothetical protein